MQNPDAARSLDYLLAAASHASATFDAFVSNTDEATIPSYDVIHQAALRLRDALREFGADRGE